MHGPLKNLEQWDEFVQDRYDPNRKQDEFRQHTVEALPVVQEFYRLNHTYQTRDFVLEKKREYLPLDKRRMSEILRDHASAGCAELHTVLVEAVEEFSDGCEQEDDDITMLVLEYQP